MSGEVILVPFLPNLGVMMLGVVVVGTASIAVQALMEEKQQRALEKARQQQAELASWQHYQVEQQQQQQQQYQAQQQVAMLEQQLLRTELQAPKSSLDTGAAPQLIELEQSLQALQQLPETVLASYPVFVDLIKQQAQLLQSLQYQQNISNDAVPLSITTVQQSLHAYCQEQQTQLEQQQKRLVQVERLLQDMLTYEQLMNHHELVMLKQRLLNFLQQQSISVADLDFIQRRMTEIKTEIDNQLANQATHQHLQQRLEYHLQQLGYFSQSPAPSSPSKPANYTLFTLPNGEALEVLIQSDLKLALRLAHPTRADKPELTEQDEAYFRENEAKWCQDMRILLQNLLKDGFQYQIQFERDVPADAITTVVVETVDEILAQQQQDQEREQWQAQRQRAKKGKTL